MTSIGTDPTDRSTLAKVLTPTALVGGVVKGLAFDRPRIALAFPYAREQGKLGKWGLELLAARATNDIVPISGGTIRIGGKVLTSQAWRGTYKVSNALLLGLVGVGMTYGIPNLGDGLKKGGGIGGLAESRSGRTGVVASIAGAIELFIFIGLAIKAPGGTRRLTHVLQHPLHSNGLMVLGKVAMSAPIIANEAGYLDFLNKGDDRDPLAVAKETTAGHIGTVRNLLPGGGSSDARSGAR